MDRIEIIEVDISNKNTSVHMQLSGVASGVWGALAPHFCQDDGQDFLKIDEKKV